LPIKLIKQELQTSNYSKASKFQFKSSTMPLSYLCDDCPKQTVTHIRESR
jgi:hypothetical protein